MDSVNSNDASDTQNSSGMQSHIDRMFGDVDKLHQRISEQEKNEIKKAPQIPKALTYEERQAVDARSVYVGNVDYEGTADKLQQHFCHCGPISRITIPVNKYDSQPKGFAYVEFMEPDAVEAALALDETLFCNRQIKVLPKRTNYPGISSTDRPPRGMAMSRGFGRGGRGRGGGYFRGGPSFGFNNHYGGVRPRGGMSRPMRRGGFNPYKLTNNPN